MGRTIFADENLKKDISRLQGLKCSRIGLIIGQVTSQRDYALVLSVTPDDEADGRNIVQKAARAPGSEHDRSKGIDTNNIDMQWLVTHALQVNRMLVGGIDIIGIFIATSDNLQSQHHEALKQCVLNVYKRLTRPPRQPPHFASINSERIILMINTNNQHTVCRTCDILDPKASTYPADWRFQMLRDKWVQINAKLSVDVSTSYPNITETELINKKLQSCILPLCTQLEDAIAVVNGQPFYNEDSSCKGLPKELTNLPIQVHFLLDCTNYGQNIGEPLVEECGSQIAVKGSICGKAYVHKTSNISEVVNVIKSDFTRSLVSRCELLSEDIEVTEGESAKMQFYKPPSRVFAQSSSMPITFCDYIFADEEPQEVLDRFSEILDISFPHDGLDLHCEHFPEDILEKSDISLNDVVFPRKTFNSVLSFQDNYSADSASCQGFALSPPKSSNSIKITVSSAIIVVILAVIVYYILYGSKS